MRVTCGLALQVCNRREGFFEWRFPNTGATVRKTCRVGAGEYPGSEWSKFVREVQHLSISGDRHRIVSSKFVLDDKALDLMKT